MIHNFIGVDPGIVDSAVLSLTIDEDEKRYWFTHKVWTGVTKREKNVVSVSSEYLKGLTEFKRRELYTRPGIVHGGTYIEGFRQRGRDMRQDQRMLALVQETRKALKGSEVLDNTGMKKIVTEDQLELLHMKRFDVPTNHQDIKSAGRTALRGMIKYDESNLLLSDMVRDALDGEPWLLVSTPTR